MKDKAPFEVYAAAERELERHWGRGVYEGLMYDRNDPTRTHITPMVCLVGSLVRGSRSVDGISISVSAVTNEESYRLRDQYVDEVFGLVVRHPTFWLSPQVLLLGTLVRVRGKSRKQLYAELWNDLGFHSKRHVVKLMRKLKERHRADYFELKSAEQAVHIERLEAEIKKLKGQRNFWMNRWVTQQRLDVKEHNLGLLWEEFDKIQAEKSYRGLNL